MITETRRERDRKILIKNLCSCAKNALTNTEIQLYHIDELARFLVYGCDGREDFEELYRCVRGEIGVISPNVKLDCFVRGMQTPLLAYLCSRICFYFDERGIKIGLSDFFEAESITDNRVTYVKNPMADEAYRIFAGALERPAVSYSGNFVSACEEVYYGRVPYCILPYENSEEGTLSGFMRLIRKYELYPHYVCSCRGESGVTRLALLGRSPCVRVFSDTKMMVRASFYGADGEVIYNVIAAGISLGLTLVKTDSTPVAWDERRYGEIVTFEADSDSVIPFLIYLALETPECSDKAVYYQAD